MALITSWRKAIDVFSLLGRKRKPERKQVVGQALENNYE